MAMTAAAMGTPQQGSQMQQQVQRRRQSATPMYQRRRFAQNTDRFQNPNVARDAARAAQGPQQATASQWRPQQHYGPRQHYGGSGMSPHQGGMADPYALAMFGGGQQGAGSQMMYYGPAGAGQYAGQQPIGFQPTGPRPPGYGGGYGTPSAPPGTSWQYQGGGMPQPPQVPGMPNYANYNLPNMPNTGMDEMQRRIAEMRMYNLLPQQVRQNMMFNQIGQQNPGMFGQHVWDPKTNPNFPGYGQTWGAGAGGYGALNQMQGAQQPQQPQQPNVPNIGGMSPAAQQYMQQQNPWY